jgi:hypothetical protein
VNGPNGGAREGVDGVGLMLLVCYVAVAFAAAHNGGAPGPLVALLLASAAALVVGRLLGRRHRALLPAIVVVSVAYALVAAGSVVGGGPLSGPLGYRNATGALCVQGAIAALMFAAAVRLWPLRILGIAAALPFAVVAALDSTAAGVSLLVIAVALIGLRGPRAVRVSIAIAAALFALTLLGVVALGAGYRPGGSGAASRALTERRLVLWHESLQIIAAEPAGVGPGRFMVVNPTALRDADAHWAHDEFLQQGVELGLAGLDLSVLLFMWGFARLWVHPRPDMVVALGAASLAALGIHAGVDYVLHFPAVPLAAAALIGTAQAVPRGQEGKRSISDGNEHRQEGVEGSRYAVGITGASTSG